SHVPAGCAALPKDLHTVWTRVSGRSLPPRVTIPLSRLNDRGQVVSVDRPPGSEVVTDALDTTVGLALGGFGPPNLSIRDGAPAARSRHGSAARARPGAGSRARPAPAAWSGPARRARRSGSHGRR